MIFRALEFENPQTKELQTSPGTKLGVCYSPVKSFKFAMATGRFYVSRVQREGTKPGRRLRYWWGLAGHYFE
jgi:hypothetical protein